MQKQLDGLTISLLVEELNKSLSGVKIDKVFSPTPFSVAIYPIGNMPYLYISCAKGAERIHLRTTHLSNPQTPPAFCMILRKYMCGGKFISFKQKDFDRIVEIEFEAWNDEEGAVHKKIVVDMIKNRGNIFLLDSDDRILDCAVKSSKTLKNLSSQSIYEPVKAQDKLNFLLCTKEQFSAAIKRSAIKWNNQDGKKNFSELLCITVSGIGISVSDEILYKAGIDPNVILSYENIPEEIINGLWASFQQFRNKYSIRDLSFSVGYIKQPETFSSFGLDYYMSCGIIEEVRYFPSPSSMIDSFFGCIEQDNLLSQDKTLISKLVRKLLDKAIKKRDVQQKELIASEDSNHLKLRGDLIINNIHLFKAPLNTMDKNVNNMVEVDLIDYLDPEMGSVRIELDPSMSVSANAKLYFSKYNKSTRARVSIAENLEKTNLDIKYFESVLESLDKVVNQQGLDEIKDELISLGHMRNKVSKGQSTKKKQPYPAKYTYTGEDGLVYEIYVGKNNVQNDLLTLKLARSNDFWLHVKDMPGSHVVIRNDQGKDVPKDVITAAATLAAFFSKGRLSSQVPVDITKKRNVKKPNAAKPGMVIYDNQNTVYVTPSYGNMKVIFGDTLCDIT